MILKKLFALLLIATFPATILVRAQPSHPNEKHKKIALTFDACMTNSMVKKLETGTEKSLCNSTLIEYLRQEKIPATIFISGLWAEKYPEVVKTLAADPLFEIANHSFIHRGFTEDCYGLTALKENEKAVDISKTQDILTRLSGKRPRLFRFPGGCYSPGDLALVKSMGLQVVGWTFASGDAFNSNTDAIIENVLTHAKPGAIVVFHLMGGRYAPGTLEAINVIVPALKKRGFEFSTVSNLCNHN
jgi:peptidoglycan-N-acetylglucosamine deacetylase